jgi:hypothetical protein
MFRTPSPKSQSAQNIAKDVVYACVSIYAPCCVLDQQRYDGATHGVIPIPISTKDNDFKIQRNNSYPGTEDHNQQRCNICNVP